MWWCGKMDIKLGATYLYLWVIVVISDLGVGVVLVNAHVHLGHSDFLSGKESSDCCLNLDDKSKLIHCDSPAKLIVVQGLYVSLVVDRLAGATITHF